MIPKILKKSTLLIFLLLLSIQNIFANSLYGGIEIGSKGVKVTVVDVQNAKKNVFELKEFWTENAGIARGISIDGNLAAEDIETASKIVLSNYQKLINEFKIENDRIFVVASSGVGMAKNTDALAQRIKELTNKDLEVISSKLEAKLLLKGCIPQQKYLNSILIDIGGGNTKGGYVEVLNGDNQVFFPLNLNYGTVTLTEKINKQTKTQNVSDFLEKSLNFMPSLDEEVSKMYQERPLSKQKKNIYMSGGAVWAFYTLSNEIAGENFNEFTYEDVLTYNAFIQNNYSRFEELAKTNKEVERVLKTYSQKHLISANNLLLKTLENIGDTQNKKLYFVKQGQIAWLLSYVADAAKGSKPVY
jgi:exopolyphosphatase/pppGpp-phosphohydrolase